MSKVPVIFLDRDGTINEEVNYLYKKEDLHILPGAAKAIRVFQEAGYKVVVVTNQAGVARGYYTEPDVERLHQHLNQKLEKEQAHIDAFYYCPHHPEHGLGPYKTECSCRKPGIGMFEMAAERFRIDIEKSWMIGDKLIDVEAGRAFGLRTVLVGTGYGAKVRLSGEEAHSFPPNAGEGDLPYDMFAETLMDAARAITGWNGSESNGSSAGRKQQGNR